MKTGRGQRSGTELFFSDKFSGSNQLSFTLQNPGMRMDFYQMERRSVKTGRNKSNCFWALLWIEVRKFVREKETEDPSIFVSKRFQYPPNALLFLSTSVISADNKEDSIYGEHLPSFSFRSLLIFVHVVSKSVFVAGRRQQYHSRRCRNRY